MNRLFCFAAALAVSVLTVSFAAAQAADTANGQSGDGAPIASSDSNRTPDVSRGAPPPVREDGEAKKAPGEPPIESRYFSDQPSRGYKGGTFVEVRPKAAYAFSSDLDFGGDFSVFRTGVNLKTEYWLERFLTLTFDANYEYSSYDFDGLPAAVPGDPLDEANRISLRPGIRMALSREWLAFAGFAGTFSGETGVDLEDGVTATGFLGGRYKWKPDVAFTLGIGVGNELEDDVVAFPILGVKWDINDRWVLDIGGARGGFQAAATYEINDQWEATAALRFEARDYRLDEDSPIPDGVLRDDRLAFVASATYKPTPWAEIIASAGVVLVNDITVEGSNGGEVFEESADPTPILGLRGRIRF